MSDKKNVDKIAALLESMPSEVAREMEETATFLLNQPRNPLPPDIENAIILQMMISQEIGAPPSVIFPSAIAVAWANGYLRGLKAAEKKLDEVGQATDALFAGNLPKD